MKYAVKTKAQKIVDDIQNDNFSASDIDALLMYLRDFSKGKVFREIADFVAHPASRDKGILNDSIDRLMSFFQLNLEYVIQKKSLDISKPIPSWIIQFIVYQIRTLDNNSCRKLLGATKNQSLSTLRKEFSVKNKEATINKLTLSDSTRRAIELFSIRPHFPFTLRQDDFISELLAICKTYLNVDKTLFKARSDKIMACILYHTHQTTFSHREGYSCSSVIGVNIPKLENSNKNILAKPTLALQSHVSSNNPVSEKELNVSMSHCLILTNLDINQWTRGITPIKTSNGNYSHINCSVDLDENFVLVEASH